jgi:hypothetical protein
MSSPDLPPSENQSEEDDTTRLIEEVTATMLGGEVAASASEPLRAQPEVGEIGLTVRLPDEHRHALQNNVIVRLCFGTHGINDVIPDHGIARLGVVDKDYADIGGFVDRLDSRYGDILGVEARGFDEEFSPQQFLQVIAHFLMNSVHMNAEDVRAVLLTGSDDAQERARAAAIWEKARRFQVVGPFQYAAGLAINKGIKVLCADAQAHQIKAGMPKNLREIREDTKTRDPRTIECMGRIAIGVEPAPSPARKPILGILRGGGHTRVMEKLLRKENVPFTTDVRNIFEARVALQSLVKAALKGELDPIKYHREKWLANLPKEP